MVFVQLMAATVLAIGGADDRRPVALLRPMAELGPRPD